MDIYSQLLPLTFFTFLSIGDSGLRSSPPVPYWPEVCPAEGNGQLQAPLSLTECSPFTFFQQARDMGQSCFIRASVLFKAEVSCHSTQFL